LVYVREMSCEEVYVAIVGKGSTSDGLLRRLKRRRNPRKKKRCREEQKETKHKDAEQHLSTATSLPSPEEVWPQELLPRSRNLFAKEWNSTFFQERDNHDNLSFVEERRKLFTKDRLENPEDFLNEIVREDAPGENSIETFFGDFDDAMALVQVDEVKEFCRNVSLKSLRLGDDPAGYKRASWVDDRYFSRKEKEWIAREHENPLTATSLYRVLGEKVRSLPLYLT
jgi:hypothetical protein